MPVDQQQALPPERATGNTVEAASCPERPQTSYGQILKSSVLIGGSSFLTIGVGVVRTKAMAVMLGPSGFGLLGLYGSIVDLALSVASMGIGSSGVRQIAESASTGDEARIARTVIVLQKTALLLGIIAAALVATFSESLSTLTFGSAAHSGAVALLGLAVFFRLVSAGQGALIQGMRRIRDLAAMSALGALLGAIVSIAFVFFLGEQGVAPSLVGGAAVGVAISWWYSRKVKIQYPKMTRTDVSQEAAALLKLGFAFMISSMLMMGASYAVRTIVLRMDGLDAAGFYSAAWTLGGLYVGIILQAMGADFYPRLVGVAQDNSLCNRLVNEQVQVSMLLAGPGVIATITFAPLVIALFYSAEFSQAVDLLRWICLGIAVRLVTWPLGFIIIAKNRQTLFVIVDLGWAVANVGLTWIFVRIFGLNGAGIAFFASYVLHGLLIYPVARSVSGFSFTAESFRAALLLIGLIAFAFLCCYMLPAALGTVFGVALVAISAFYSFKVISSLVSPEALPGSILRLLKMGRTAR